MLLKFFLYRRLGVGAYLLEKRGMHEVHVLHMRKTGKHSLVCCVTRSSNFYQVFVK
jgi:hypothetical protein